MRVARWATVRHCYSHCGKMPTHLQSSIPIRGAVSRAVARRSACFQLVPSAPWQRASPSRPRVTCNDASMDTQRFEDETGEVDAAWELMGRVTQAGAVFRSSDVLQLQLKLRALRTMLDLPDKDFSRRIESLLIIIPGLVKTLTIRQDKLLAALIREVDHLPGRMVRTHGLIMPARHNANRSSHLFVLT
jgi:hypothetical protein